MVSSIWISILKHTKPSAVKGTTKRKEVDDTGLGVRGEERWWLAVIGYYLCL